MSLQPHRRAAERGERDGRRRRHGAGVRLVPLRHRVVLGRDDDVHDGIREHRAGQLPKPRHRDGHHVRRRPHGRLHRLAEDGHHRQRLQQHVRMTVVISIVVFLITTESLTGFTLTDRHLPMAKKKKFNWRKENHALLPI